FGVRRLVGAFDGRWRARAGASSRTPNATAKPAPLGFRGAMRASLCGVLPGWQLQDAPPWICRVRLTAARRLLFCAVPLAELFPAQIWPTGRKRRFGFGFIYETTISTVENTPQAAARLFEPQFEQKRAGHAAQSPPRGPQAPHTRLRPMRVHGPRNASAPAVGPDGAPEAKPRFPAHPARRIAFGAGLSHRQLATFAGGNTLALGYHYSWQNWRRRNARSRPAVAAGELSPPPARVGRTRGPRARGAFLDCGERVCRSREGLSDNLAESETVEVR